jgi:hypothetical protein
MRFRRAATSVLLSIGAEDFRIPNNNDADLPGDATVTEVSFSVEGQPILVAIGRREHASARR